MLGGSALVGHTICGFFPAVASLLSFSIALVSSLSLAILGQWKELNLKDGFHDLEIVGPEALGQCWFGSI